MSRPNRPKSRVGRQQVAVSIARRLLAETLEPRLLCAADLDTTFNGTGLRLQDTTDASGSEDRVNAIVRLANDKMAVAGVAQTGSGYVGAIARLNANGYPDGSFGDTGRMISSEFFEFSDVKGLGDGSLLATGYLNGPNGDHDFGVIKFLPDGSKDLSFGNRGIAYADFGGFEKPSSLVVQSNGHIVVAGRTDVNGSLDFAVARFDASGNLDTTFDTDGRQIIDFLGFDDEAREAEVDAQGRIVIAGRAFNGANDDFALVRLTSSGALDNGFGTAGRVRTDFFGAGRQDEAFSLELQAGGTIVLGGFTYSAQGDKDFALARYGASGALLAGFGNNGQVVTDFTTGPNPSDDSISEIKLDANGRIVALGTTFEGGFNARSAFAVAVYNGVSGQLDTSIDPNTGGRMYSTFYASTDHRGKALEIDSQGRWILAGDAGINPNFSLARYSGATPTLDTSFASGGRNSLDFSHLQGQVDVAKAAHVLPSGGSIVVGQGGGAGVLAKLNPNGTLDTTFAFRGKLRAYDFDTFEDVASLPDGSLLVAGSADNGHFGDFGLMKVLANGQLDGTFGSRGVAYADFGGLDYVTSLALQADGKVVVAGYTDVGGSLDFAVARFDASGNLDTSFDNDGLRIIDFLGFDDEAREVEIDAQGRIVLVGKTNDGVDNDFALARLTSSGALDNGFGTAGKVRTDIFGAGRFDEAVSLEIQPGGTLVAGGFTHNAQGNRDFALARYGANGALLAGFGNNGQVVTDFTRGINSSDDTISEIKLDSNGRIVALGTTYEGGFNARSDFALAAFNGVNGQLDASVDPNTGGRVYHSFFAYPRASGAALAIDQQGKWLAVGSVSDNNIAITRLHAGLLTPDASFGTGGRSMLDFTDVTGSFDSARAVEIMSNGQFVVVGTGSNGLVARFNAGGAYDHTFGVRGKVIVDGVFQFRDVKVLADRSVLAVGSIFGPTDYNFVIVKLLSNGELDTSFGNGGFAFADFGGTEFAYSLAVQADGKIVAAGESNANGSYDAAVARFLPSGTLDTSFSSDGLVLVDFLGFDDEANEVKIDGQGRIVLAGTAFNGNDYDFALVRLTSGGALDNGFGTGGKVRTDFFGANRSDTGIALVLQANGGIVVGGYTKSVQGDYDFALARYGANGALQSGFGTNGLVVTNFSRASMLGEDLLADIALDASGRIVALGTTYPEGFGAFSSFALVAYDGTTGQIDTSLEPNSGGRIYTDFYAERFVNTGAIAVDAQGRWLAVGDVSSGSLAMARFVTENRAPVMKSSMAVPLAAIAEDNRASWGTPIWQLLAGVSDADANTSLGLAITNATTANGFWQFTLNGGNTWQPLGIVSGSSARLLPANGNLSRIRFIPNRDFSGTATIGYFAWDQTQGIAGGLFNVSNAASRGGSTAFSTNWRTSSITVTPMNDPPVVTAGGSIGYQLNTAPVVLAANAVINDDSQNFAGGFLVLRISSGADAGNRLLIRGNFWLQKVNSEIRVMQGSTHIGNLGNDGVGTRNLRVNFTSNATPAIAQQLLRSIQFRTTGSSNTQQRVVDILLYDGKNNGLAQQAQRTVNVSF